MRRAEPRVLVVVGFAEALSAPEVVWSLVDAGFRVIAFSRRGRRTALHHSRHVSIHEISAPERDAAAALQELIGFLESSQHEGHDKAVLLPLDDAALWLCSQIPLSSAWIFAGARGSCAELALSKEKQIQTAAAAGLRVPPTRIVSTIHELDARRNQFPLILRPANAAFLQGNALRKGRHWICSDDGELQRVKSGWEERGPLLMQPFLEGVGEGVFGLATESGVVAWSAHRRLRMMNPHGSGASACISQAVPGAVRASVSEFIKIAGWRGMFMVELLRTSREELWFVEFNGRAWGSMALSRRQSLEYPAWTVKLALDRHYRPEYTPEASKEIVCKNVGRELMHLAFVMRGSRSRAIRNWPSLFAALRGVLRFHRRSFFYNWRPGDWRVFVSDCWYTVRDQVFKG